MDMFILLTVLQMLSLNEAYNFTCPSQAHWSLRAKSMCKPQRNYTCLFNVTFRVNVYRDRCSRPRILGPGYKYVFQPNLNRATCSATRYQPFFFATAGYSDCAFQKSLCTSLGQETYEIGNTTVDRKCICNTDRGYSFVRNPKNQCYCNPSTEDCSCYLGINPYNETVEVKDIKCYNDIKMTRSPNLGDRFNISQKIKIVEFDNYRYNVNNVPTNLYRILAAILVLILSFACVVVWIIVQRAIRGLIKTRSTPRKLDIVEFTDCSITIEWFNDVPDECLSYELDHRPKGTKDWSTGTFFSEEVLEAEDGRRMYTLQNLLPETYYEFKMRYVDKDAKSHYSESMTKKTLKLAPKKLDIVECTDCSITIEWFIDVSDECLSYELDHRPKGTNDWSTGTFLSEQVLEAEDGRRMYTLQNLLPETYYELKMRSVYKDAKSHYSESMTKKTLKLAPKKLDIVECTDCSITIEWFIDVSDECLSYELDHRPKGTNDWSTGTFHSEQVLEAEDGRRMYTLQNLLPETYYELKMRSVYKDAKSHYSESMTKKTLKLAPRKLDIVECTDCSIIIEWFIDVLDECLSYELDHRPKGTNDWSTRTFLSEEVLEAEDGGRMYTLQNLLPETYYELKMRSVYKDAKSHYSESMTKQTLKLVLPEAINQLSEGDKTRYNKIMQTSKTENRYFVRIMIVGKESAGKTCLLRRLLKESISDVSSTDGVDIVVRRCKINIKDGKWIIGKEIDDDKVSRIKRALIPNAEDRDTQNMQEVETNNINISQRDEMSSYKKNTPQQTQCTNAKINLDNNKEKNESSSLVMPEDLMSNVFSKSTVNTPLNLYALCELWDFAGQKEFYATHQAFLTSSAVYLVVADMKDEISKQGLSQCSADFQHIGEYIDFWFDSIHCHRTTDKQARDRHFDPPILLVFTGKDKYDKVIQL
ncbi:unnamed protein product [Mytilus coruscus]|uniref:Fibronectin type-III domain-containing protein n=1 Tax=Mytilus coruscus TaxID=42192 RepID=A0A6J8BBK2_MYTCO|nr:unnamed protein product [Mytilus coruscus]